MTPLGILNSLKGKDIIIQLKSGKELGGKLVSTDLNSNIGIEIKGVLSFFQGESINTISSKR